MVYYPNIFQWILTGGNASWSDSIASLGVFFNRFNNQDYSNGGVTEGSSQGPFRFIIGSVKLTNTLMPEVKQKIRPNVVYLMRMLNQ